MRRRRAWVMVLGLFSVGCTAGARQVHWMTDHRSGKTVTRYVCPVGGVVAGRMDGADTVALVDALGREFARGMGPDYRLRVPAHHTDWNHVIGYRDGRETACKPFLVAAPRGNRDLSDYLALVWYAPTSEAEARALWEIGAVGAVGKYWRDGHEACLRANTFWYHHNLESKSCFTTYHANRREFERVRGNYAKHPGEPTKYAVRTPCLNDPATFERLDREQLQKKIVRCPTRDLGTLLFYEIADEGSISKLNAPMDFCFGPHCLREMRTWLRQKYGELDRLNRTWGSSFENWDAVVPDTTFQALARTDRNYASWCDHRAFMDRTLSRFLTRTAARIRELSGGIEAGYLGTEMPSPFGGYDWYLLANAVRLHEPYHIGESVECLRSFAPPGARVFRTFYGSGPAVEYMNWRHLFHDQTGTVLWATGRRVLDRGKLTQTARRLAPHLFELRSGIGKLIIDARRINDDIALHYSQQSIRVDWMVDAVNGGNRKVPWPTRRENYEWSSQQSNATRSAAIRLIEDNQLQFRFVATPEIEAGVLRTQGFKLLVLHHSFAIGAREADAIRRFVAAGGVVVSDAQVGTFDGHGTRAKRAALEDLFGITGVPPRHAPVRDEQIEVTPDAAKAATLGLDLRDIKLRVLPAFETVRAADGVVLAARGKTPIVVAKRHGKGLAVYLNVSIPPYLLWRLDVTTPAKATGLRKLIGALAAHAGVRRTWAVGPRGTPGLLPYTEVCRYANGDSLYFAALRNYHVRTQRIGGGLRVNATGRAKNAREVQKGAPVTVRLPRRGHVYDVRARKYLGETDRVDVMLDAFRPALFAILPARFSRLNAAATFDRTTGYAGLSAELKPVRADAKAGAHVFHVEVTDPSGRKWLRLLKNYPAPGGVLNTRIFLGTNAAPGRWTFLVRDAATGIEATPTMTIPSRQRAP